MKIAFILLILLNVLISCNSKAPEGDLIPLSLGNQWIYSTGDTLHGALVLDTITVAKDTIINNEKWYILLHTTFPISWILNYKNDGVHIYDRDKAKGSLFLKKPASKSEVYVSMRDSVIVKDTQFDVTTEAGSFKCYYYRGKDKNEDHPEVEDGIYACPGVGVVRFKETPWFDYKLVKFNLKK